jgi:hypothetical protein
MDRGKLDKETARNIDESLPSVHPVLIATQTFSPELISIGFPPNSKIPIAAVCLQDATSSLNEARYALFESLAHIVWYREKVESPNEKCAIFFGKFYADDTALRLFAVKEHITNAIANILKLDEQDLRNLRNIFKKVDDLTRIGKDLKNKSPNHPLVNPIFKLINSEDWKKTRKYRNDWVHNKPPMIKGLGVNYKRKNRLIVTSNSLRVTFGQGDEPEFSIDDLLEFVKSAFFLLVESTTEIVEYFIDYLNKNQKTEF